MRSARSPPCDRRHPLAPNLLSSSPDRAQPHPADQAAPQSNRPPVKAEIALRAGISRPDAGFGMHDAHGERRGVDADIHDRFGAARRHDRAEFVRSDGRRGSAWRNDGPADNYLTGRFAEQQEAAAQRDIENRLIGRRRENAFGSLPADSPQPGQKPKPANLARRNFPDRAQRGFGRRQYGNAMDLPEVPRGSELVDQRHAVNLSL